MTEALTRAPPESKIFDNAGPEEPIEPKAPVEGQGDQGDRGRDDKHHRDGEDLGPNQHGPALDELLAKLAACNCGGSKPAEDDSEVPTYAPSSLILSTLRAGQRMSRCRRGNYMSLQAPRRRRGRRTIPKPKNQEAVRRKAEAGASGHTTHAYLKARNGQHDAIGKPATAHEDRENC